ncbi:TAT-variant-translocated molybdopterin oxidoreductase [Microvirga pudoricolor]|uniref:TAT-variant-translocated molybdopterin oxidoreductase n=1 Tax=Microvirga pudoricolor TaxID=2778729 RepID=UPI001951B602|nr:TAT-variant-translocated molybdopterin oxidoreductase [Microvirga pudoricolor]MBM6594940.1 TAT-variant-translocated molybdopterin oxidoreductase [Microvirga pudoricolor]
MASSPLDTDAIRARLSGQTGQRLWRSLEDLADAPEMRAYVEAEFPDLMRAGSIDRRTLLRLMGASLALAGLGACGDGGVSGKAPLISRARNVPGVAPGTPVIFATSLERDGYGLGVLVRAQDGRSVKVEGNPLHPASLGATDAFMQAEVLSLYDPDRSRSFRENGRERQDGDPLRLLEPIRDALSAGEGRGLHVLMEPTASPTAFRLVQAVRNRLPGARWHRYAPLAGDARHAGATEAFGRPLDTLYDLSAADVIVALGGDLFLTEPGSLRHAADYQGRRRNGGAATRLIAVESTPSLVGAKADERVVLRPRDMEAFARDILRALDDPAGAALDPRARRLASELRGAGPRALVTVGREQPAAIHALAHRMHARLGALSGTVRLLDPVVPPVAGDESLSALARAIEAGSVSRLLILGGNPAYDGPADLGLPALIRRVPFSVHLSSHYDETGRACRWHIPQCHPFEAFGDTRAVDGTAGLRQPTQARLAPSFSRDEILGLLAGQGLDGMALTQATWRAAWAETGEASFRGRWEKALEDGVVEGSASTPVAAAPRDAPGTPNAPPPGETDIVFAPDPSLWDGRYANNGWLQELPKPFTKQAWGNAALIAPETAGRLGLSNGAHVEIGVEGRSIVAPVWLQPGQAPDTLTLPLGYGRTGAGSLGNGIGFDAYRVRPTAQPWIGSGRVRALASSEKLISTQHHHALNSDDIIRIVSAQKPVAEERPEPPPSLYPPWTYDGYAWGMAVDLDACIGCNACVIACQSENNVAVVGPEEVARGREMHWLRIDRYFAGTTENPDTYFQPVPCMHCETAPCEVVCPVNATVHSSEGINDMVYNRCIGTRTCSNNCPYKVRRFNFLDYHATPLSASEDVMNPQVSIRDRGVMEKCTFCIQRIGEARINARIENREVRDGEIRTACQQACPTQAITFGNLNDRESEVSRAKASERNYALLGELNTKPRTTYLARIEKQSAGDVEK